MARRKSKTDNKYRSKFEGKVAEQLKKYKVKFEYESEIIRYTVPESKHYYKPDFILPNGVRIEAKGKLDSDTRKKMALIKEQHPTIDIRILFMRDQPIRKGSSTLYSDWAKKTGYDFAFTTIPPEWLEKKKEL